MWMYYAIVGIVCFATLAMMVREGLWSNTVTLANILICGLLAFGLYPPLTMMVDEALDGEFTYLVDFLVIWGVFVIAMIVARIISDRLSRTRLRLRYPIDAVGGPLIGAIAAFVMASFVAATLHTAPLADDSMGGALKHTKAEVEGGKSSLTSPDLFWLHLVEQLTPPEGFGGSGTTRFSAAAFVEIYGKHREALKGAGSLKVRR